MSETETSAFKRWHARAGDPRYTQPPSRAIKDALLLPLLFHGVATWGEGARAEWLRITGTTEATTRSLCDHLRYVYDRCGYEPPPLYLELGGWKR